MGARELGTPVSWCDAVRARRPRNPRSSSRSLHPPRASEESSTVSMAPPLGRRRRIGARLHEHGARGRRADVDRPRRPLGGPLDGLRRRGSSPRSSTRPAAPCRWLRAGGSSRPMTSAGAWTRGDRRPGLHGPDLRGPGFREALTRGLAAAVPTMASSSARPARAVGGRRARRACASRAAWPGRAAMCGVPSLEARSRPTSSTPAPAPAVRPRGRGQAIRRRGRGRRGGPRDPRAASSSRCSDRRAAGRRRACG